MGGSEISLPTLVSAYSSNYRMNWANNDHIQTWARLTGRGVTRPCVQSAMEIFKRSLISLQAGTLQDYSMKYSITLQHCFNCAGQPSSDPLGGWGCQLVDLSKIVRAVLSTYDRCLLSGCLSMADANRGRKWLWKGYQGFLSRWTDHRAAYVASLHCDMGTSHCRTLNDYWLWTFKVSWTDADGTQLKVSESFYCIPQHDAMVRSAMLVSSSSGRFCLD